MLRKLLTTTAVAAFVASGAFAQTATQPAPAETPAAPVVKADGQLASNIIGENVYNSTAENAENIGDVNDIVIGADGSIDQIVIGVGGFLGIGEKNVALDYKNAEWAEKNGDRWIVLATSKEALEAAPAFDPAPYEPAPAQATAAPAADQNTAMNPAPSAPAPAADAEAKTGAIDKSTLTAVPEAEVKADNLTGTTVYGADDSNIGEIGEVIVTPDGKIDAVVLDVGGFLGIGEKKVAVGTDNLALMTDADGNRYLYTTFTKEQLEAQPAYDSATFADKRDEQILKLTR